MALRRVETLPVSALITNKYFLFHFSAAGKWKERQTSDALSGGVRGCDFKMAGVTRF
jgi:hypothetical protein